MIESRTRLAALAVGLGALGVICLMTVTMGHVNSSEAVLMQEPKSAYHVAPHNMMLPMGARPMPTEYKVVSKGKHVKGKPQLKSLKRSDGQQLKLTFSGETPIGDDDFDAAGYNMEGVWDWKQGKFRSPKFEHEATIEAYEDPETGDTLDIEECAPDDSLPKAILYDDPGEYATSKWARTSDGWYDRKRCGEAYDWWDNAYPWADKWQCYYREEVEQVEPAGDHELPQGFYSTLGDACYDDRPINVVKDRTKNEAAWMGGCNLAGCVLPGTASALELPDGVNVQLFDQPNFMGNSISFQGPIKILRLADYTSTGGGWDDRIQSMKVMNSIGLDAEEPKPVDRVHGTNWIYPDGPDSSLSKYDTYFNQWDELDSSPHEWRPLAENMDGDDVDVVTPDPWQADVNNLY